MEVRRLNFTHTMKKVVKTSATNKVTNNVSEEEFALSLAKGLFDSCNDKHAVNDKAKEAKAVIDTAYQRTKAVMDNPFFWLKYMCKCSEFASLLEALGFGKCKKLAPQQLGVLWNNFGVKGANDFAFCVPCSDKATEKLAKEEWFCAGGQCFKRVKNTKTSLKRVLKALVDLRKKEVINDRFSTSKLAKQKKAVQSYLYVIREDNKYKGFSESKLEEKARELAKKGNPTLFS